MAYRNSMQRAYFTREISEILKIPIRKCSKSVVNFRNVNIWTPVEKGECTILHVWGWYILEFHSKFGVTVGTIFRFSFELEQG